MGGGKRVLTCCAAAPDLPCNNPPSSHKTCTRPASAPPPFNAEIWLNNIRYAMVDQLRRPRPGFEEAVRAHFRLLRWRIMKQCGAWLEQAAALDPLFRRRLRDAVVELHGLLAAL